VTVLLKSVSVLVDGAGFDAAGGDQSLTSGGG